MLPQNPWLWSGSSVPPRVNAGQTKFVWSRCARPWPGGASLFPRGINVLQLSSRTDAASGADQEFATRWQERLPIVDPGLRTGMTISRAVVSAQTVSMLTDLRPIDLRPTVSMLTDLRPIDLTPTVSMLTDLRLTDLTPTVSMLINLALTDLMPTVSMLTDLTPIDSMLIISAPMIRPAASFRSISSVRCRQSQDLHPGFVIPVRRPGSTMPLARVGLGRSGAAFRHESHGRPCKGILDVQAVLCLSKRMFLNSEGGENGRISSFCAF